MARVFLVLVAALTGNSSVCIHKLAFLAAPARSAWVDSDYPSSVSCGVTVPVEQCNPADAAANSACRDMCHYGGCRGGGCVSDGPLGGGRGCRCRR
ncbi:hypothetical protein PR202_ga07592 [Eleusine coracana subsp. coracana]|uniref:Secreted protein n=1 Tax=Eleusine coracana subsp. coracana TaxID=191504 RepID=A0AAV5BZN5_ELECO|nr:hypothetical protein PR202_ga07592 [Eleusine coracana subsp. coracana]